MINISSRISSFLLSILLLFSLTIYSQSQWEAPKSADKIHNPLKDNANATKKGKKTYIQLCIVCHGPKGKGDGIAGAALNTKPADFNSRLFQVQSDGAIFWKLSEGRPPMAPYRDILTETQRWELINYIKSFNKTN
jgi:mono/diheme cytochrome c family protein